MNRFLFFFFILISSQSFANTAKLTWTHNYMATDGSKVVLTEFRVYWGVAGTPESNMIRLGPPLPKPWKIVGDMSTWSKTLSDTRWLAGMEICFRMTALAGDVESDQSNPACKVFPANPNAPALIDIDRP